MIHSRTAVPLLALLAVLLAGCSGLRSREPQAVVFTLRPPAAVAPAAPLARGRAGPEDGGGAPHPRLPQWFEGGCRSDPAVGPGQQTVTLSPPALSAVARPCAARPPARSR